MKHLAFLISVIILKSCGSTQDVASATNATNMISNDITSGTYIVEQLNETDLSNHELTLEFDAKTKKVSGYAGCNRFFGTYSSDGNSISFSELGATRMSCDESSNAVEFNFFQAMRKINTFDFSEGQLRLKHNDEVLIVASDNLKAQSRQMEVDLNMTYKASTRGFFEMIWVEGKTMKYTNDRNLDDIRRFQMTDEQFSEIKLLYDEIDVKTLPSLEPPSKTFQYDAAAFATLEVTEGDNTYKTMGFDHGNPHKSIAKLIMKVLYLKETMSKQ